MKHLPHRLNPLALLGLAALLWTTPGVANEVNLRPRYLQPGDAIELYVPPPDTNASRTCLEFVGENIDRVIGKSSNQWGILVESLDRQTVIYSHNADKYFIPASNTKLFTTVAALQALNPETAIRTKSLRDWVNITNQRSNNAYADALFKFIGGSNSIRSILSQLGIDPNSYHIVDGSGLSRQNLATPRALVEILRSMYYSPNRDTFYASLPVAGVSGTLKRRLRSTAAEGTVYAKTGTLWGVRALSGYLDHPETGLMVFSILANNSSVSGQTLVKTIDSIVLQLTQSRSCQAAELERSGR